MTYIIDYSDENHFFIGAGIIGRALEYACTEDCRMTRVQEFTPEQIVARNESISKTWEDDALRAQQSLSSKSNHRNHDPVVNAKKVVTLKATWADPARREAQAARQRAAWARRKALSAQ